MIQVLDQLSGELEGELFTDITTRTLYATDASAYRELPIGVAIPKSNADIAKIISFANSYKISVIPRTAGTSLAGQVVGAGLIVDVSKHFSSIIEVNAKERWVRLQPGVVLDELNLHLKPFGLFFAPETSTSNRCMIGGMVGNNSCGSHSVIYGTTRDHLLEVKGYLSDGKEVIFRDLSKSEFEEKIALQDLEGEVYRFLNTELSQAQVADEIRKEFPKPSVNRRNTGYAIDVLLETEAFSDGSQPLNLAKLIAGSEGTLCFMTELKLNLLPLPPAEKAVVAVHLNTISEATRANNIALKYKPGAVELLDDIILECTKSNIEQSKNRFFVQGDPGALLIVEFARDNKEEIDRLAREMEAEMRAAGYGYHFPVLYGSDINKVWSLRKAGLGLLGNIPGDRKGVPCIEDTAVDPADLPSYIDEFQEILKKYELECVFYAHIGDGEIHLRPVLNLKEEKDRQLFYTITDEVATLVKKYRGSLSGEHGDGRVRGPFIKKMIGEQNYDLICRLKRTFDPNNLLNPGKIVEVPPMTENLRYENNQVTREIKTNFDFSDSMGVLRMAEQCNGAGDCRKSHVIGGTMCPSYMATKNEQDSTRARANILREFLTHSPKENPFDHKEIYEVMDLCLSCKGCKSECNSNVDVARLKAEFLQNYYDANGVPFRSWVIAHFAQATALNSNWAGLANFAMSNPITGGVIKRILGIAPERNLPLISNQTLEKWIKKNPEALKAKSKNGKTVYLFADEYTNYNEADLGVKAIKLLTALGYEVRFLAHPESARTFLSKGLVRKAAKLAEKQVQIFAGAISAETPLLGIEPSAILGFRDEYPKLVPAKMKVKAEALGQNCLMIDEFLAAEFEAGRIAKDAFKPMASKIKLHGHCHQKAIASVQHTKTILSIPQGNTVEVIPSGCCGMAGSFGYEKEHYALSQQIGELVLFPAVRNAEATTLIAAPGTSCRHQIKDGTGKTALHPVEILFDALA